jgi:hypothetical protein
MLVAEFVFTFALVFTVLQVATASATEGNSYFGLAIGFIVMVGAFAVGAISGAAFNPAIALGASVSGLLDWSNYWVYLLADLVGGAAAAAAFLYILPDERVIARPARRSPPPGAPTKAGVPPRRRVTVEPRAGTRTEPGEPTRRRAPVDPDEPFAP